MAKPHPEFDVYRDEEGNPVTFERKHIEALRHSVRVVESLRQQNGRDGRFTSIDLSKSRLLGRMLVDGRPPLEDIPPKWQAAAGYHLVEPDETHFYLGESFPDLPGTITDLGAIPPITAKTDTPE